MKKTPWFPPEKKPVRVGVYETGLWFEFEVVGGVGYQFWNGSRWDMYGVTPWEALRFVGAESQYQEVAWRGLAKDPNA
jgi:hypothetical protein